MAVEFSRAVDGKDGAEKPCAQSFAMGAAGRRVFNSSPPCAPQCALDVLDCKSDAARPVSPGPHPQFARPSKTGNKRAGEF